METGGAFLCSLEPTTDPYHELLFNIL